MSTLGAPVRQARYFELDSLRGLAAMIVVLHHLRFLWQEDAKPSSAICRFFLDLVAPFGTEAVMLFFVLSGFVLSLPTVNGRPQTYFTFLIRRIFRIYVPYLAALLVWVVGAFWLHGIITRSDSFHQYWSEPVNWHLVGSTCCSWASLTRTSLILPYGRWSTRCASRSSSLCFARLFCD